MNQPKPRRRCKRYSSEFKREALFRASEEGVTDKAVCDECGISTRQFKRWRDELALLGSDAFPGSGFSRDQEVATLKHELVRMKKERDFLRDTPIALPRGSMFTAFTSEPSVRSA